MKVLKNVPTLLLSFGGILCSVTEIKLKNLYFYPETQYSNPLGRKKRDFHFHRNKTNVGKSFVF